MIALEGPWRQPVNPHLNTEGSIHHDATAQKLGLKGGTVAGNNLLELFPPIMIHHFGKRWFEQGSISMYFRQPISNREEVRALVECEDPNVQAAQFPARVEGRDGAVIAEGTVSIGLPTASSALHARPLDEHEPGEIRLLEGLAAGQEIDPVEVTITDEAVDRRVELIEQPLEWFLGPSPWGFRLMPMSNLMGALQLHLPLRHRAVGLFGAIEVAHVDGPVFVGQTYSKGGKIAYVGTSPKTEYVWYDSWLNDGNRRVAEMRFMLRFMKASSPLWQKKDSGPLK